MKAKLLIVTTLFSSGGERMNSSSVIAEFVNTNQADAAFNVIEDRGSEVFDDSLVSAMKLY